MVGVKMAPGGPMNVKAQPAAKDRNPDLPPLDCRFSDDFKELADCQLVIGRQKFDCHSQILGMHSPVLSSCFSACKEKVIKLDECIPGVDPEALLLLLMYMYNPDPISSISSMDLKQLEAAAVLADVWAMTRFLELCDARLHGSAELKLCSPEAVVDWLLRAHRLQAKCEAFVAARFNELKYCERMEDLSKDTWMRLMYISSYKVQGGKEAVLHRWITKGMPPKSNLGDRKAPNTLPPLGPITWQNETDF